MAFPGSKLKGAGKIHDPNFGESVALINWDSPNWQKLARNWFYEKEPVSAQFLPFLTSFCLCMYVCTCTYM
jgi:hypothetical protein